VAVVQDVEIPLPDDSVLPAALARPIASAPAGETTARPDRATASSDAIRAGVVVIHEVIGLNDDIRRIAARFADAGYVTIAPDFLAGLGPMPFCIARFARGIGQARVGRPDRQLSAAEGWLRGRPDVADSPIGVVGFCMGGFPLLHAAGADIDVVAPFYAAMPRDGDTLAGACQVVASYGGRDRLFGAGGPPLEAALTRLGIEHDVKTDPAPGHSFMNRHRRSLAAIERRLPTHGGHDDAVAEDAWQRMLAFFARYLGPSTVG